MVQQPDPSGRKTVVADESGEKAKRKAKGKAKSPPGTPARVPKRYPSSIDVARLAGVSQSAVSRTYTEGASVSKKTRAKVLTAARELGYSPSILPRILVTHKSNLIAIVIGGMYNPFYAHVFELFSRKLQEQGSQVLVFFVDHGEYIDEAIPIMMKYRIDGIITALSILSDEAADECAKMSVPVVLFNGKIRNEWVGSVCCDNVEGGRQIANLMHRAGRRKFAYIAGTATLANTDRRAGFVGRLGELGVYDVIELESDFRYEGGHRAAIELMNADVRPDAIFCANDLMALGAMEAIRDHCGLSIPRDVMVAGFDDVPAAGWPSFGLTTVQQAGDKMVDAAVALLTDMIAADKGARGRLELVPGVLMERSSTKVD